MIIDLIPRFTTRFLLVIIAFLASIMAALRASSAIGVIIPCILMLAYSKTTEILAERKEKALPADRKMVIGLGFNVLLKSILIFVLSDMMFLCIYIFYDGFGFTFRHRGRGYGGITVPGVIGGLIMAIVMARRLRICFWSNLSKSEKWSELANVFWWFLGIFITGVFMVPFHWRW